MLEGYSPDQDRDARGRFSADGNDEKSLISKVKNDTLKGQNDTEIDRSTSSGLGGRFEEDKGRATTDVIAGAAGPDSAQDTPDLYEANQRQKAGLEKLYSSGSATIDLITQHAAPGSDLEKAMKFGTKGKLEATQINRLEQWRKTPSTFHPSFFCGVFPP